MSTGQYGRLEYWEERYMHKKESFDWYHHWAGIKDIVTQYVFQTDSILHAGCGTSSLPFDMANEGYSRITNFDASKVLIEDLKANHKDSNMQWHLKDVRTMDYPSGSFDAVIEKGLLDSVLSGDRSRIMAQRMISQIYRVLNQGGKYICVTHAVPEKRLNYFESSLWKVTHYKVSKPRIASMPTEEEGIHYVYVCRKKE